MRKCERMYLKRRRSVRVLQSLRVLIVYGKSECTAYIENHLGDRFLRIC